MLSDECVTHSNRVSSKPDAKFWDQEDPHAAVELTHSSQEATAWRGMRKTQIAGSTFCLERGVASENYKRMLR